MPTTGNAEAPQAQHVYSTTTAAFYVAELLDQPELGEFERKRAATGGGFGFYDDPHDHAPRLGEFRALPSQFADHARGRPRGCQCAPRIRLGSSNGALIALQLLPASWRA